jgi:hypothetical protein
MRLARIAASVAVAGALALIVVAAERNAPTAPQPLAHPVVVELFTSQGCSSCPPADELLSSLREQRNVIPLAFHVDYWDHLGWRDPFSARQWTARQMAYVRTFALNGAYTPQMVVGGTKQFVGSDRRSLADALASAGNTQPAGDVRLSLAREGNTLRANVHATLRAAREHDLLLVIVEDGIVTKVERGENHGRTLPNDAIVRKLVRVGALSGGAADQSVTVTLDPAWKNISAVAFLQDAKTLAIDGAATARP